MRAANPKTPLGDGLRHQFAVLVLIVPLVLLGSSIVEAVKIEFDDVNSTASTSVVMSVYAGAESDTDIWQDSGIVYDHNMAVYTAVGGAWSSGSASIHSDVNDAYSDEDGDLGEGRLFDFTYGQDFAAHSSWDDNFNIIPASFSLQLDAAGNLYWNFLPSNPNEKEGDLFTICLWDFYSVGTTSSNMIYQIGTSKEYWVGSQKLGPYHVGGCIGWPGECIWSPSNDPKWDSPTLIARLGDTIKLSYNVKAEGYSNGHASWFGEPSILLRIRASVEPLKMKIVRIDAEHDLAIRDDDGQPITNPIWTVDDSDTVNPIADVRGSDSVLNVRIQVNLKPDWDPRVIGRFVYYQQDDMERHEPENFQNVMGRVLDVDDPDAWIVEFRPTTPTTVGKYTLDATFIVLGETEEGEDPIVLDRRHIEIPFYVVFAEPKAWGEEYPVGEPHLLWLDTACQWGKGAEQWSDVVILVKDNEYRNPLNWIYNPGEGYIMGEWYEYVKPDGRKVGHCWTWADVWVAMVRVLGVPAVPRWYARTECSPLLGIPCEGGDFITKGGLISLAPTTEGYKTGNIFSRGSYAEPDRWRFFNHCVGYYGHFFVDPTFGKTHTQLRDAVFCDYVGRGFDSVYGSYIMYANATGCDCELYENTQDYICYGFCETSGVTGVDGRALDRSAYKGAGKVVDWFSDYGLDTNGDGLYDYLVAVVTIDVNQPGTYQIFPELELNESTVIPGDTLLGTHVRALPMCELSLSAGANTISLYFNGRAIHGSGVSGPYTAHAILYDEQGNYIDDETFTISAYNHIDFQTAPLQVASISDYGEDTDGDSLFNYLTTELTLDLQQSANYSIQATLFSNETFVESVSRYLSLEQGVQKISFPFDGKKIGQSRSDGPYSVQLFISDGNDSGYMEYETQSYQVGQFQLLDSTFTGAYNDYGTDTDGDGRYDYLVVEAEVTTIVPSSYNIIGRLYNDDGNEIAWAYNDNQLDAGTHFVPLEFDALAICKHQVNGPYSLSVSMFDANGTKIDWQENAYTTASYDYLQFQKPSIEFTDRYDDYGVDEDRDGLYERMSH